MKDFLLTYLHDCFSVVDDRFGDGFTALHCSNNAYLYFSLISFEFDELSNQFLAHYIPQDQINLADINQRDFSNCMLYLAYITTDHTCLQTYNLCLFHPNNTLLDLNDLLNSFYNVVAENCPEIYERQDGQEWIEDEIIVLPDTFESFNNLIFSDFICNTLNITRKISSI